MTKEKSFAVLTSDKTLHDLLEFSGTGKPILVKNVSSDIGIWD
jgi:hypothetical protein